MNRVKCVIEAINFIEQHHTEKLDLAIVANAMHYSKYHLHRIFTKAVGLTIHDYIQRRQLTEAAKLLVFSEKSILDIALDSGYESQQAFSDIFEAMYKLTPNQFRQNEVFYPLQLKYEINNYRDLSKNKNENERREILPAEEKNISLWMELVHLSVDGFPNLKDSEHIKVLRQYIKEKRAFIRRRQSGYWLSQGT